MMQRKRRLVAELQRDLREARGQTWQMVNREFDLQCEVKLLRAEIERLKPVAIVGRGTLTIRERQDVSEALTDRRQSPRTTTIDPAFDSVSQLLRECNAERAILKGRFDAACEIIANHLDGGSTDRALERVERACRLRSERVERDAT